MSQINGVVMPDMIPVTREQHPLGVEFLAYYGNSKFDKKLSVTLLIDRELAISHWLPTPRIPTISEEHEEMCKVLAETMPSVSNVTIFDVSVNKGKD